MDGQPRSGDGSWAYGWQPMANCLNLTRTLIADWLRDNEDINPSGCIEMWETTQRTDARTGRKMVK